MSENETVVRESKPSLSVPVDTARQEFEALKGLGLHPGGNCEGLCHQDQEYYTAKGLGVEVMAEDFPRPEWD